MLALKDEKEKTKNKELDYQIDALHNMQWALKILLNSCYGAFANKYFRWYDINQAEAVTMSGQLAIRWIHDRMNEYMNKIFKTKNEDYIIAVDTDAIYLKMELFAKQLNISDSIELSRKIDKICEGLLQPFINKTFDDLADYVNAYEQAMVMKREAIAEKGIWLGKKHYVLNCWNIEGVEYKEPYLKTVGIEVQKSSTPKICRESLKKAISFVMNKDEETVQAYVNEFKTEFMSKKFEEIAFPRGVNGINEYKDSVTIWAKGTPIHTKGALIHNHLLKKNGLDNKYPMIVDGDKIKFAYMKERNPYNIPVFAMLDEIPEEFDIQQWTDYNLQFEKTFLDPLNNLMKVIGWSPEKINTVEGFLE